MKITYCRSCGSDKLKDIISLGSQYLSDFIIEGEAKPPKYPLDLVMCKECTLVQLRETTPSSELYTPRYGYKSGISETIKADLRDVVEKAQKYVNLKEGDIWIDQGSNDGTLLSFVPDGIIKIAVEPIKKLAEDSKKYANIVINDFWSYEVYEKATKVENL